MMYFIRRIYNDYSLKIKVCSCFLPIFFITACTQWQIQQHYAYKDLKSIYKIEKAEAKKFLSSLSNIKQTSYIIYKDSKGRNIKLSNHDAKRMIYILSRLEPLPKKNFIKWFYAAERSLSIRPYYIDTTPFSICKYCFYRDNSELITSFCFDYLCVIEESRINEYLQSEELEANFSLPDKLEEELYLIHRKYYKR